MKVEEIIEAARLNFGEKEELTLLDTDFEILVNKAIQELFILLPLEEVRPLIKTDSINFTVGRADIPETWDKVISIRENESDLGQVLPTTIQAMRDMGPYFSPGLGVWAQLGNSLITEPDVSGSLDVIYTEGPTTVSGTDEVTEIPEHYHPAIVNIVTSYAYAQEEDVQQAQDYHSKAMAMVMARRPGEEG